MLINNEKQIFFNLYGVTYKRHLLKRKNMAKIILQGDDVRLKYKRGIFDKGFYPNWTDESFKIIKAICGVNKTFYRLKSANGSLKKLLSRRDTEDHSKRI